MVFRVGNNTETRFTPRIFCIKVLRAFSVFYVQLSKQTFHCPWIDLDNSSFVGNIPREFISDDVRLLLCGIKLLRTNLHRWLHNPKTFYCLATIKPAAILALQQRMLLSEKHSQLARYSVRLNFH